MGHLTSSRTTRSVLLGITLLSILLVHSTEAFFHNSYGGRGRGGLPSFHSPSAYRPRVPRVYQPYRQEQTRQPPAPRGNQFARPQPSGYRQPIPQHDPPSSNPSRSSQERTRQYKVEEAREGYLIHIEAPDILENPDEFVVDVNERMGQLTVQDRSKRFYKTWEIAKGVRLQDIQRRNHYDKVFSLLVPKRPVRVEERIPQENDNTFHRQQPTPASPTKTNSGESSEPKRSTSYNPNRQQRAYPNAGDTARFAPDERGAHPHSSTNANVSKEHTHSSLPRRLSDYPQPHLYNFAIEPSYIDPDLDIAEMDNGPFVFKLSEAHSGYWNMQGDFVPY